MHLEGAEGCLRAAVSGSKAGPEFSGTAEHLGRMPGLGHKVTHPPGAFMFPEDPLPLFPEDPLPLGVETASLPSVYRGDTLHRLPWGLNPCLASYLVAAGLSSQSHGAVGGVVWENVRDAEVKTLQDVRGLHLPRGAEP